MKQLKKTLSLLLAFCLLLSFSATAFAWNDLPNLTDDAVKPTVDVDKHVFTAYQIFAADYETNAEGNNTGKLVSVRWGDGVNAEALCAALKADATLGADFTDLEYTAQNAQNSNPSAYKVALIVSGYGADSEKANAFAALADANKTGKSYAEGTTLPAGYYLVVDQGFTENNDEVVFNLSVLTMSNADEPFNPTVKADVPKVEKKVLELNDSKDSTGDRSQDWADAADYDINDTVEFALSGTLPSNYDKYDSYKYVFTDTLSAGLTLKTDSVKVYIDKSEIKSGYTFATTDDGFTVTFENLKAEGMFATTKDSVIQVRYNATLNKNAVVGGEGNPNQVTLTYSNNPNAGGAGSTATTTPDKVVVYTYKLTVNKTDETGNALAGAEFELYKKVKLKDATEYTYELVSKPKAAAAEGSDIANVFTFSGLDAGDYKLVETDAPATYNKAEDMYFTISSTDTNGAVTGKAKVEGVKNEKDDVIMSAQKDEDGNAIPMFKITSTDDGNLATSIVNMRGLVLPSTGGIGTTIFYIAGGLLLVGAGVLLIAKKRMGNK